MTTAERAPESETPMIDGQTETTAWAVALKRLQHPAPGQNHWFHKATRWTFPDDSAG